MIAPGYAHVMARYNHWQNRNVFDAAETLSDAERRAGRGAHFGSIMGTLCHIFWADATWMARIDGWEAPDVALSESPAMFADWEALKAARWRADERIKGWAERVTDEDLAGELTWVSGLMKTEVTKPLGLVVMHLFNHQTHHRGQVHAMLTAAGASPGPTDLGFMPEDAG